MPMVDNLTQLRQLLDTPVRVSQVQAKVVENMALAFALTNEAKVVLAKFGELGK